MVHAPVTVEVGLPQPRRYGLYSVAPPIDNDRAAGFGVQYDSVCAGVQEGTDPCESPGESPGESPAESPGGGKIPFGNERVEAGSFPVYALFECNAVGMPEATARQRAEGVLSLTEERAVEAHLWSLLLDPTPSEGEACTVLTSVCEDVCFAVGAIEHWLARNTPGQGVIHAPIVLEPLLSDGGMLVRNGPRLETPLGTPYVLGAGYDVNADDPNMATIVGTGQVHVYRGDVVTVPTFDHTNNTRAVLAERSASVSFECGCVSALVAVCETES